MGALLPFLGLVSHFYRVDVAADGREHETQDAAAIGGLPPEELIGEFGGVVPGEFERSEGFDAALSEELRQLPAKAEGVGKPCNFADTAKFLLAVALTVEDVTGDRLSANNVEFWLNPEPCIDTPFACLNLLLNLLKQLGGGFVLSIQIRLD